RGKDRVAKSRRERRYAGLAHAARRHIDRVVDDVRASLGGRLVDAHHLIVVEVRLLDGTTLEGNLAVLGKRQPHDGSAFDLRADPFRMHAVAAVDGRIYP